MTLVVLTLIYTVVLTALVLIVGQFGLWLDSLIATWWQRTSRDRLRKDSGMSIEEWAEEFPEYPIPPAHAWLAIDWSGRWTT